MTQEIQEISVDEIAESMVSKQISNIGSQQAFSNDKNFNKNVTWEELNLIARNYMDLMQTKTGYMHRLSKMIEQALLREGLLIKEEEYLPDGKRAIRYKKPDFKKEAENKINGESEFQALFSPKRTSFKNQQEKTRYNFMWQTLQEEYDVKVEKEVEILKLRHEKDSARVEEELSKRDAYIIMHNSIYELEKQKKKMVHDASQLYDGSALWSWCLRTKGLGEVAALTFMGYMNPMKIVVDRITGQQRYATIANVWSYIGLTPFSKLRRGQQANSNPELKGRVLGVIIPSLMKKMDNYYHPIYLIKKEYYKQRPDLVAIRDGFARLEQVQRKVIGIDGVEKTEIVEEVRMIASSAKDYGRQRKGWVAWMDNKSRFNLCKILLSHAYQIIKESAGMDYVIDEYIHRNLVPIKPENSGDDVEYANKISIIHNHYKNNLDKLLTDLKIKWQEDTTPNKAKYTNYLTHSAEVDP